MDDSARQTLTEVDVFALNAAEAQRLTGHHDLSAAADSLAALTPVVVVKNGSMGAVLAAGGERNQVPTIPVEPVDTIGAGDCFDAGFVAAYVLGLALDVCVQLGTPCGSLSTRQHGGAGSPTLPEIAQRAPHLVPWAQANPDRTPL